MKKGDIVIFSEQAPLHLTKELGNNEHEVEYVDSEGWIFLKDDTRNPKKMIHQISLHIVKEA